MRAHTLSWWLHNCPHECIQNFVSCVLRVSIQRNIYLHIYLHMFIYLGLTWTSNHPLAPASDRGKNAYMYWFSTGLCLSRQCIFHPSSCACTYIQIYIRTYIHIHVYIRKHVCNLKVSNQLNEQFDILRVHCQEPFAIKQVTWKMFNYF